MKKYEMKLLIEVLDEWWIDVTDFEIMLNDFNIANENRVQAKIIEIKKLKEEQ